MIVKIQHRRGNFADFDPTQLLPSELAIIQADDPNTNDGTAIYLGISSGVIKRIPTSDEVSDLVDALVETALNTKQDVLTFDTAPTAGSENVLSSGTIYSVLDALTLAWSKITNKPSINSGTGINATIENGASSASGDYAHAEGFGTYATAQDAHAEGLSTTSSGLAAHVEGRSTTASGDYSHAENKSNTASGRSSHAEGENTIANHKAQHVFGEYNVADTNSTTNSNRGDFVEIVGNGTASDDRSNARTLDWSGNEVLAGKLTVGTGPSANMDVTTKQYVDNVVSTSSQTALSTMVTPFSTESIYTQGALCLYNGTVYICTCDENSAVSGEWDSTKWTATTLSSQLEKALKRIQYSIAYLWDSTQAYSVGDYVFYNWLLYKCVSATTANEGWVSAHWQLTTLPDEIESKQNTITIEGTALML